VLSRDGDKHQIVVHVDADALNARAFLHEPPARGRPCTFLLRLSLHLVVTTMVYTSKLWFAGRSYVHGASVGRIQRVGVRCQA
jgi:hypothetical protein